MLGCIYAAKSFVDSCTLHQQIVIISSASVVGLIVLNKLIHKIIDLSKIAFDKLKKNFDERMVGKRYHLSQCDSCLKNHLINCSTAGKICIIETINIPSIDSNRVSDINKID